jgi:hypothetical protein
MKRRPIAACDPAWLFIIAGAVGMVYHFHPAAAESNTLIAVPGPS